MIASHTHKGVPLFYEMSSKRPTLRQMVSALSKIAAQWRNLGIQLDIDPDVLAVIEADSPKADDRMRALLEKWLQKYPESGWDDIVRALKELGRNDIALIVTREYCHDTATSSPSPLYSSSSVPSPLSPSLPSSVSFTQCDPVTMEVPKNVVKKLEKIEDEFYHLVSKIKEQLRDKLDQKDIARLAGFCSGILQIKHFHCCNIDDLFTHIQPHLHFLNYSILQRIDRTYLHKAMKPDIKKYKTALNKFTKSTSVSQFKSAIEQLHPSPSHDTSTNTTVWLKAKDTWNTCTVYNMDRLIKYLFPSCKDSMRLVGIHHSVLTIVCTAPLSAILCLTATASKRVSFIGVIDIISIQVGPLLMAIQNNITSLPSKVKALNFETLLFKTIDEVRNRYRVSIIELLVYVGADINIRNNNGMTALMHSCRIENADIDIIKLLLKHDADVDVQDNGGRTALTIAINRGHLDIAELLLQHGANPNIHDIGGDTALSYANYTFTSALLQAVHMANVNVAKLLSKVATDLNFNNIDGTLSAIKPGSTPLMVASCKGLSEIVEVLLEQGADPKIMRDDKVNSLLLACQNGHLKIVELLTSKDVDLNVRFEDGRTPLMFATQREHAGIVEHLLKRHAHSNIIDKHGATALTIACRYGYTEVASLLLNNGADPNLCSKEHETPLMLAGQLGTAPIVKLLLEKGANPNVVHRNGGTALMVACQNGHIDAARLMLEGGADPDMRDSEGWTALMFAAHHGHRDVVKLLHSKHASIHLTESKTGSSALMIAVKDGNLEMVDCLLDMGADRNMADDRNCTALMVACCLHYNDIAKLLIQRGADPEYRIERIDAFLWSTVVGNLEMVRHFIETTTPRLRAGLIKASLYGHVEMIKLIVENLPNCENQDLIDFMYACIDGDISRVLHHISTNPAFNENTTFLHDVTPLMLAASCGHLELVDILLDAGANMEDLDVCGYSAFDYADKGGHEDIAAYLYQRYNSQ